MLALHTQLTAAGIPVTGMVDTIRLQPLRGYFKA